MLTLGLLAGLVAVAPVASAHHPALSGVGGCQPNGTYSVTWSVRNSETSSGRFMLVRAFVAPAAGTTSGLTADPTYNGPVNASYAGPGTLVAPGASATALTTDIPGSTTGSVTLSVTGRWSYGTSVVETRTATVNIGALGPCRSADLAVTKTSAAVLDRVNAGGLVRYTIGVTNLGPDTADAVKITDQLPTGSTLATVQGTDPCWVLDDTGNPACTIGTLVSGASASRDIVLLAPTTVGVTMVNRAVVTGTGAGDPNPANNVAERSTLITQSGTIDSESNGYVLPGTSLTAADASTTATFSVPVGGDPVDTAVSVRPLGNQEEVTLLFGNPGNKDRTKPVRIVIDWGTKKICIFLTNCGTMIDPDNEGPQPLQVAVFCKDAYPGPRTGPGVVAPLVNWRNGLPLLWCIDAQYRVGPSFRLVQEFIGIGDPRYLR
jgi:uncharacterized repeat protein (TIGR01451 family)